MHNTVLFTVLQHNAKILYVIIFADLEQLWICILQGSHFLLNLCLGLLFAIYGLLILPFLWNLSRRHSWNLILCPGLMSKSKSEKHTSSQIITYKTKTCLEVRAWH